MHVWDSLVKKHGGVYPIKKKILNEVKINYQTFFQDRKRAYKEIPLFNNIFKEQLEKKNIKINGNLYHHSQKNNKYGTSIRDKRKNIEILPEPRINSIKNPMFNKAMGILRKMVNKLIINGTIDKDTEVIIEIARELNDNNKRYAIERYQREREENREKYREFLKEFRDKEKSSINIEKSIGTFELWTEQLFEETEDERKKKIQNKNNNEILKEKEAEKRYELWMEQKGQCIYTGKMITISQLFSNEIDIAHTIPRSALPDNTMANMTVSYARYNRDFQKTKTPFYCDNYSEDSPNGTAIFPRLERWKELRDRWQERYEKNLKPSGHEDEEKKNKRIQSKHYCKLHFDYWKNKIDRFEAEEIKDSWARRQLTDTQMISKYAREFLQTYFKKISVQKGRVTSDFRKMYGFQEEEEIKNRNKHTHHAIDAAVLTLIPANNSYRDRLLKEFYEDIENFQEIRNRKPFKGFNAQELIRDFENNIVIVNYTQDNILKKTFKNIRKRGRLQYLKDKEGNFILDKVGNKIILKSDGDSIRSVLYQDTFVAKIRDVERYVDGQPKRDLGSWKFKSGKDEFIYAVRKPIDYVLSHIDDIIDPTLKELVRKQKDNLPIIDFQGKVIRHVRIKTNTGQKVKERLNYRSEHEYKNHYYSAAGSIPYAILLQKSNNGKIDREMIPIASFELAKMYKQQGCFNINYFIEKNYPHLKNYHEKKLLKIGQKVIVLNNDSEYDKRKSQNFQIKRLYRFTQFGEGCIYLKYHLTSVDDGDIDKQIKLRKDEIVSTYDKKFNLPIIMEDMSMKDVASRKKKYENERFRFVGLKDFRFNRLIPFMTENELKNLKKQLDNYSTQPASIKIEGETPLLKINNSENWNFLYEGEDFKISLLGDIYPMP